jgi:hypothetical protein
LNYECEKSRFATGRILDEYNEIFFELELADLDKSIATTHSMAIDKANKIRVNSLWRLKRYEDVVTACTQAIELFDAGNFLLTRAWANMKIGAICEAWTDVRRLVKIDRSNRDVCSLICVLEGIPLDGIRSRSPPATVAPPAHDRPSSLLNRVYAEIKNEIEESTSDVAIADLKIEEVSCALRRIRYMCDPVLIKQEDDDDGESDPQVWTVDTL